MQVSIAGNMPEVERARDLVRGLTPITFQLEVPGHLGANGEHQAKTVQDRFPVMVTFRQMGRNLTYTAFVKGCVKDFARLKEGTLALAKSLGGRDHVSIQLNITPQHHHLVFGPDNINLQIIMQATQTHIACPNTRDRAAAAAAAGPFMRRGTLLISGTIDGVFLARQE